MCPGGFTYRLSKNRLLLYQVYAARNEFAQSLAAKHVVLQQSKIHKLVKRLVVLGIFCKYAFTLFAAFANLFFTIFHLFAVFVCQLVCLFLLLLLTKYCTTCLKPLISASTGFNFSAVALSPSSRISFISL